MTNPIRVGLISAVFLTSCVQRPQLVLVLDGQNGPNPLTIRAGERIRVDAIAKYLPGGAQFIWIAPSEGGRFEPQISSVPYSNYVAPPTLGTAKQQMVDLRVDIVVEGSENFAKVGTASLRIVPEAALPAVTAARPPVQRPIASAAGSVPVRPPANRRPQDGIRVAITTIPPADPQGGPDTSESIAGSVEGVDDMTDLRIVLYSRVLGRWWVQPRADSPFTRIRPDKTWSNWTHTGDTYAALLVSKSFTPPPIVDSLPEGSAVIGFIEVDGRPARSK